MKKIDKLVLGSFLGPFILTFLVVVFILLSVNILKYFPDIIGKDLGFWTLSSFLFYFSLVTTPVALPLAILLSSLLTFGNLGEHFELTAIKSLGISLNRAMLPMFIVVIGLTVFAFYANNVLVPKASLEAYSLLYDIKQKKPALDLRKGVFYGGIPDIFIKVNDKLPDGQTIKDIIIYDHRGKPGNREVIMADSGKMYTLYNDQYLKLELYNGYNYSEGTSSERDMMGKEVSDDAVSKTKFDKTEIMFDLSSFALTRTDKRWFQGNRIMRNLDELVHDMDSINGEIKVNQVSVYYNSKNLFTYHLREDPILPPLALKRFKEHRDSVMAEKAAKGQNNTPAAQFDTPKNFEGGKPVDTTHMMQAAVRHKLDSLFALPFTQGEASTALGRLRMIKSQLLNATTSIDMQGSEFIVFQIQWHKILASSVACIAMFLIGAPLGSIIKKGGLGIPVLASILFFIVFYVFTLMGEKWAKQHVLSVPLGVWLADIVLFVLGMVFLRQARRDARLFEADTYNSLYNKLKMRFWPEKD
ncbi:MAG: LptF/LptG family permease [Cyclobacteriaceae bacterium]